MPVPSAAPEMHAVLLREIQLLSIHGLQSSLRSQMGPAMALMLPLHLLSQKWDPSPCVQYANIHTKQRYCLYCIFAQVWVLGDNSTKLACHLAESQGWYTLTNSKKLLITFWLVHCFTHLS